MFHPQPTNIYFELIERGFALSDGKNAIHMVLQATVKPDKICFLSNERVLHRLVELEMGIKLDQIQNVPSPNLIHRVRNGHLDELLQLKSNLSNHEDFYLSTTDTLPNDDWHVEYSSECVASFYKKHPINVKDTPLDAYRLHLVDNQTNQFHDWVHAPESPGLSTMVARSNIFFQVDASVPRFYVPIGFALRWHGYALTSPSPVISSSTWTNSVIIDVKMADRLAHRQVNAPILQYNPPPASALRGFSPVINLNCY